MAGIVTLDLGFLLLAVAGIALAVVLAVVAGRLTARLFFDASRRESGERGDSKREVLP